VEIKDKAAIVTGAGGDGSGRAIACRLAHDGALVVVSDINEAGGEETVRLVERAGGRAVFRRTDVRVEEEIRDLIDFAEKTYGTLDILINNASAPFHPGDPLQHWSDTIQTDFLGMMHATRLAIDAMKGAGGGAIVNMSSISALWHGRKGGSPAYDTAKAGRASPYDYSRVVKRKGEHPSQLPGSWLDRFERCSLLLGIADSRATC
jgi:NAD(P)-dependent dehydrogenase (short-subunit alcohol dehydrogenase family)